MRVGFNNILYWSATSAFLAGCSPTFAQASTASTTFNVTVTITRQCSVSAPGSMTFPTTGSAALITASPAPISQTFAVTCPAGTAYTIGFTSPNDLSVGSTVHQMKGAIGSNTNVVQYTLSDVTSGATNTTPLGGSGSVITSTATGSSQTKSLQATIVSPSVAVAPDTYTDTVTMTVTY